MIASENINSVPVIFEGLDNENSHSLYDELVNEVLLNDPIILDENIDKPVKNMVLHRGYIINELIEEFINIDSVNLRHVTVNIEMYLTNGAKELGLDVGGVFRDALSEFWNSFYETCTNGTILKVPIIREDYNKVKWEAVAKIIYVGWKQVRYYPIKLSPVFMENCILNQTYSDLINNFLSIVSETEKDTLKTCINNFDETDFDELIDVLDNFECKRKPNKNNAQHIIYDIAHKEIIQKPKYIIDCWAPILSGLLDFKTINNIYDKCDAKPKNVLNVLQVPDSLTSDEIKIYSYLKKYIREADKSTLEKFLRFCTGADLITDKKISIQFKNSTGIQRTPVAHTCSSVLELDVSYDNFPDFRSEINSVLSSNIWVMDFA